MKQLELTLRTAIADALHKTFSIEVDQATIALQPTRKEFAGTFTFVTFPFTKQAGKGPEQIGQALGEFLKENAKEILGFNVVKGFLNLEIAENVWVDLFREMVANSEAKLPEIGKKIVVEYSSPNTNKPLHLGHLRNNFLGFSVSEILEAAGNQVSKVNLINDRGIHICKSMLAYQQYGK